MAQIFLSHFGFFFAIDAEAIGIVVDDFHCVLAIGGNCYDMGMWMPLRAVGRVIEGTLA